MPSAAACLSLLPAPGPATTRSVLALTEPEAREKYGDKVKVYKTEFTAMYYAMMEPEEKGPTAYKIVCVGPEEKVVGLHILGQGSSEILQGFGVAIKMGATKQDFDNCVVSAFSFLFVPRPRGLLAVPAGKTQGNNVSPTDPACMQYRDCGEANAHIGRTDC